MPSVVSPLVSITSLFGKQQEMSTDEPVGKKKEPETAAPPEAEDDDQDDTTGTDGVVSGSKKDHLKDAAVRFESLLRRR